MELTPDTFSRITKLFVDRDGTGYEEVQDRLSKYQIALVCGPEVAESATLQAAVLTAANVAGRCFPGGISFHPSEDMQDKCVQLPWPETVSFSSTLKSVSPNIILGTSKIPRDIDIKVIFGNRPDCDDGLLVTYDGWVAAVGPTNEMNRLPEREMCVISGVAGGAMAVSEIFLDFAQVTIEATRRCLGLSLWRPDLHWEDPEAIGVPLEYLPSEFWLLGLGHLGQAYLWTLSMLPYKSPKEVNIILQDFDKIIPANMDTGLLTKNSDIGIRKTRVSNNWLQSKGFDPSLVERAFDEGVRRTSSEPTVAFCGFDGKGPRHILDQANFDLIVECGLGGRAENFDAISFHTLPNSSRTAAQIWPDAHSQINTDQRVIKLANECKVYQTYHDQNKCGHVELAGKAVAVPFVGATASSLVIAEVLRIIHDGNRYENIELSLECLDKITTRHLINGNKLNISYQPIHPK